MPHPFAFFLAKGREATKLKEQNHTNTNPRARNEEIMDRAAVLNHEFTVAAFTITWCIQLGYLAWLGMKWRAEKRDAALRKSGE